MYQGELIGKERYYRRFFRFNELPAGYDVFGLELMLEPSFELARMSLSTSVPQPKTTRHRCDRMAEGSISRVASPLAAQFPPSQRRLHQPPR
jgi:hypothetical protein